MMMAHRDLLTKLFDVSVAAALPSQVVRQALPPKPKGRVIVIGAGKASAAMAKALEDAWDGPLEGLVITRYGYGAPCQRIEIVEAAHPVPDRAGVEAAQRMVQMVAGLTPDDLVISLISGGGSSLLCMPPPQLGPQLGGGSSHEQSAMAIKQKVNSVLLASGAPIGEMNAVRKALSLVKGGRLAATAAPAKVVTLVISDIPGDDPALVASGPTIPDARGAANAWEIVQRYKMQLPLPALRYLQSPGANSPDPTDECFARNEVHMIATAQMSLEAAAKAARKLGHEVHILSDAFEGEARIVGGIHANLATQIATRGQPFNAPALLLSGGETTVTLSEEGQKSGRGGRNTEFLLGFAFGIEGAKNITALAADTDGIDGSEANAGALANGTSIARLRRLGHDPKALQAANDAWGAFDALDDLLVTGPTNTNVNDFRAVLIAAGE